jgi:galactokinase
MKKYLKNKFIEQYKSEPELYLSCGGRFEVLGNHTDHNHGLCLAATCSLSIYASIKRRDDLLVHLFSEGFTESVIDLSSLDKNVEEKGQPGALVRGVAAYLAKEYKISGFDIYIKSEIPGGAGVSSSAAFELLFAQTFNKLFNNEQIPLMTLCKAGQYAEREFYGKMCGLLDQIGVAYGGLVYIDFEDIANPKVKPVKAVLENYCFVIVNSGGSHAGLDHLYKAIPDDMYKVAHYFGKDYLREVEKAEVIKNKQDVIDKCGELAYERALHFYGENRRVKEAFDAIEDNDLDALVRLINESRESSTDLLHNMYVNEVQGSPLEACELIMKASNNKAGVKINGGGFAGSVIALVPLTELDNVLKESKAKYGEHNVHLVNIRNSIPSELK